MSFIAIIVLQEKALHRMREENIKRRLIELKVLGQIWRKQRTAPH